MRARPVLLGIAGDSAAGKTTLTRGLVRVLGESRVTHVDGDHFLRYTRQERHDRGLTPLSPDANYLDILEQQVAHLRADEPILKPVYDHHDGEFKAAEHIVPAEFTIVEGLLTFHTQELRDLFDVRVFLEPPEELRRHWKVQRDSSRRGYTTEEVLNELDLREDDAMSFIRPQQPHADIVISFLPGEGGYDDPEHLDARVTMRPGLVHPDLSDVVAVAPDSLSLEDVGDQRVLLIKGDLDRDHGESIQEILWDGMHFASHLRTERLGEFTTGADLHRSETLSIIQLLLLHHLVTARAAVAIGASSSRAVR